MMQQADRIKIIKEIITHPLFMGDYNGEEGGILTFLEMTWDLRTMPSNDSRYITARDDIWKHIVVNDDISIEELFLDRLPTSHSDENIFISLINSTVHPSVISNDDERSQMVAFVNDILYTYGCKLVIDDYFGDIPIHVFSDNVNIVEKPEDIRPNNLTVYNSSAVNKTYPCLVLKFDSGWNDWFKWRTLYQLEYYLSANEKHTIGYLKLMKKDEAATEAALPMLFIELDDSFCSVGCSEEYYLTLKQLMPETYHSILLGLRDAAIYPKIKAEFIDDPCFSNSLLRDEEPKFLLDSARYILNGMDVKSYYKFSYSFMPPYSPNDTDYLVNFDFDFKYGSDFDQRIYALVGKNGAGKTTLLSRMASDFSKETPENIIPQKPLYNKILTISFSFFDKLPIPSSNACFNYVYLGLKGKRTQENNIEEVLIKELKKYLITINDKHRGIIWISAVDDLFHEDIANRLGCGVERRISIDVDKVIAAHSYLSSGETLMLYILSSILGEIDNNALILFDEPETHLHPNAISAVMNVLYYLLKKFNSFCILATHSPLVIQEVSSRNVKVLKRCGDTLELSMVGYETFAENLTTITDEIFGNREVALYHKSTINDIVKSKPNATYEELLSILQNEDIPTSLNAMLYLKTLLNEKSEGIQ